MYCVWTQKPNVVRWKSTANITTSQIDVNKFTQHQHRHRQQRQQQ